MELAQIDMIYSLLSMLNTDDKEHISRTLLGMSTCRDSCIAMRQAGCMSLLVQLIHGCPDNATSRILQHPDGSTFNITLSGHGSRVARQRAAAALHNLVHCLPDEKWRRREARVLKLLEIVREYSDNQQQRMASNNAAASGISQPPHAPVDSSRVGPAIAALMKLSFDEDHRHAITVLGGLQAVSELLVVDLEMFPMMSSVRPAALSLNIRRFGCMTLTNLTFGDVTNKALLCSMPTTLKAVVALVGFLENEDIVQAAGSVLRNLSWSADPPSKTALRDAGAVKQLVRSVMAVKREATRTAVFSALWNVSAHLSENKAEICSSEGALDFIAFALTLPGSIGESAGGVLRNISSHIAVNNDYRHVLRRRGCLEVLVNQLKSSNLTTVSNACGALWNLSAKCAEDQQVLWELGAVANLQALSASKHQMIATAALAAIRNLQSYKQQVQATNSGSSVDQQQVIKQSLNKTSSETNEPVTPLSSSFPGPGRQQQSQMATNHVSTASFSSPLASVEKLSKVPIPNNNAIWNASGGSNGAVANLSGKNPILYSDTPNSNMVHLNYLHMLATRAQPQTHQPQSQQLATEPLSGSQLTNSSASPRHNMLMQQVHHKAKMPGHLQDASTLNNLMTAGNVTNNVPITGISINGEDEDDDEQPTNFGQRFQESDLHDQGAGPSSQQQPSTYANASINQGAMIGSVKSNLSPTGSTSSNQNNENKGIAPVGNLSKQSSSMPNKMAMQVKQPHQQGHVTFAPAVETVEQTPMFSRRSSVDSLNSVDVPSIRSEVVSEYSRLPSGALSPSELPESPGAMAEDQRNRSLEQHQHSVFRMPPPVTNFTTPQQMAKARLLSTNAAPLASNEESFPAVDCYADEAERPVIYATEDTPAVLSHATSLSNLTTPGFETPVGTFSPVRNSGIDRNASPPGTRLLFRKPVEPEPVEDEVFQYYTEDTPCHLSASSSLSSLSVMSHASSRRSTTNTPLRQKVFALQSGAMSSANTFTAPGTGGSMLHPRVAAAAARHADPFIRNAPFVQQSSIGFSPFVATSPMHRARPNAVLLEESEDSNNLSGLSNDQIGTRDVSLHEEEVEKPESSEEDSDEASNIVQHGTNNSENGEIRLSKNLTNPNYEVGNGDDEDEDDDESETDDLIQQLIETALEKPVASINQLASATNASRINSCPSNETCGVGKTLFKEQMIEDLATKIDHVHLSELERTSEGADLDSEPTAKELEMLEECINSALTPSELGKPMNDTKDIEPTAFTSTKQVMPSQSKPTKRNSLTVVSGISSSKLRSPQKLNGPSTESSNQALVKANVSHRRKSVAVRPDANETSPLSAQRSTSPGSISRGGSSSGGGSTARQMKKPIVGSSVPNVKKSPNASASKRTTSSSLPRRSRSRGEDGTCLTAGVAAISGGPNISSKLSPSSSTAFSHTAACNSGNKTLLLGPSSTNAQSTVGNTRRWNFSTRPNPSSATVSEPAEASGKPCCKHVDRIPTSVLESVSMPDQPRPSSNTSNQGVWYRSSKKSPPSGGNEERSKLPESTSSAIQAVDISAAPSSSTTTTTTGSKTSRRMLMTTV